MTILVGEIGKKTSKLALIFHRKDADGSSIIIDPNFEPIIQVFETKYDVSELKNMISVFLKDNYDEQEHGEEDHIYGACFSITALIEKGEATLSDGYKTVTFTEKDFKQELPCPSVPVTFLNDMIATGYDVFLSDEQSILQPIHQPDNSHESKYSRALMLVSEGLGAVKWICPDKKEGSLYPESSEWGHSDFSTRTEKERSVLKYLEERKEYNGDSSPVSKEYVLSNRGLQRIYYSLESPTVYNQNFTLQSETIIEKAIQGDSLCKEALELFMSILGAEAGNLALTFKSQGGIYIVTDLPIPLSKFTEGKFTESDFIRSFINKVPEYMKFRDFLNKIPVNLIQKQDMGIWGSAKYALKSGFVKKGKFAIMKMDQ